LVADGGLALRLAFHGPLDWPAVLGLLDRTAIPGVERVTGDVYRRTVQIGGDLGVLELAPGGDDHLVLRAHLPHWEGLVHIVQRARHIANLDTDQEEAVRQLGRDPVVGPVVRARPGVRVPGTWDGFETGVRAVVGQTIGNADANATVGRLVERYGTPAVGLEELGLTHVFPEAAVLADADFSVLGLPAAKASAIRGLAAAVADGRIRLDRSVSFERLVASLKTIPGVGTAAAHHVALRLGEPDAFPLSNQQLARLLRVSADAAAPARALVDRWRPWRAVAMTHLWIAGEAPKSRGERGAA
jgi:AraC family transcriptional regulator of adaptative response / DNA-3-methyladenine glycosylase II